MLGFLRKYIDSNQKVLGDLETMVADINSHEPAMQKLKSDELAESALIYKKRLNDGATLDDILPEFFALVREASVRSLKMRPFDVQLMAAIAFHQGKIAEQKTGEGKTLSAVPAIALNALTGKGVHVVTVNDYLARRDAGWMAPIYHLLGLSVGVIYSGKGDLPAAIYDPEFVDATPQDDRLQHLRPVSRREAYAADVTYGTNNEFGFDYLRDNMANRLEGMSQRGHNFAIVDEVDSILIDEARTPLIISAPDTDPTDKYYRFAEIINNLSADTDYEVDEKVRAASLTDHGLRKLEKLLNIDNIYEKDFDTVHHIEQALKARALFVRDKDYIVKDQQIIIVDDHTGRLMYGRRYSDGLHQAIEAKEKVPIQQESRTLATISLQNYFRMYQKLAGMTGTAESEAEEFKKIYDLEVVVVPTNQEIKRKDFADVIYKTTRAKYAAVVSDVAQAHAQGQPVLIGTKSIEQNDVLSQYLKRKKIPHQVLNAKNHENEAEIIADAGRIGAVTVATNIAGRGVDIVLGGSQDNRDLKDWKKDHQKVIEAGGLHVIGAIRHESRRIDNQLRGRSGRQGDPGSSRFYVSLEDDIMRIFGGDQVGRLMDMLKVPEDQPLEAGMVSKAIETAQRKVESHYFDMRKSVVEYDDVVNKQREIIYKLRADILHEGEEEPEKLRERIKDILEDRIEEIINILAAGGVTEDETNSVLQNFYMILPLDEAGQKVLRKFVDGTQDPAKLKARLWDIIEQAYDQKTKRLGGELMSLLERTVYLSSIDQLWMEHLDALDDLRDGIRLRGYAQQDPLVAYKGEAYGLFEGLLSRINDRINGQVMRLEPQMASRPSVLDQAVAQKAEVSGIAAAAAQGAKPPAVAAKRAVKQAKVGRNEPCPCGSGLKYKKCGLIGAPEHRG
jgi:preprotein translocase subunit SecA